MCIRDSSCIVQVAIVAVQSDCRKVARDHHGTYVTALNEISVATVVYGTHLIIGSGKFLKYKRLYTDSDYVAPNKLLP